VQSGRMQPRDVNFGRLRAGVQVVDVPAVRLGPLQLLRPLQALGLQPPPRVAAAGPARALRAYPLRTLAIRASATARARSGVPAMLGEVRNWPWMPSMGTPSRP